MEDVDGRLSVLEIFVLTIERKAKNSTAMKDAEWEILDRKTLRTIQLCLAASVAFNISKKTTTKGLIKALAKLYEKPSASNKVFLMKHLFNKKMSEGGSVADHLNDFNTATSCWVWSLIILFTLYHSIGPLYLKRGGNAAHN